MENDAESTAAPPRNSGSPEFTYYVIRRQRDGDGEVGLGFVNRFCGFFFLMPWKWMYRREGTWDVEAGQRSGVNFEQILKTDL